MRDMIDFGLFIGKKVKLEILKPGLNRGFNLYGYIEKYDDTWLYFMTDKLGVIRIENIISIEEVD